MLKVQKKKTLLFSLLVIFATSSVFFTYRRVSIRRDLPSIIELETILKNGAGSAEGVSSDGYYTFYKNRRHLTAYVDGKKRVLLVTGGFIDSVCGYIYEITGDPSIAKEVIKETGDGFAVGKLKKVNMDSRYPGTFYYGCAD